MIPLIGTPAATDSTVNAWVQVTKAKGTWNTAKAVGTALNKTTDTALSLVPLGGMVATVKNVTIDLGKYAVTKIAKLFHH